MSQTLSGLSPFPARKHRLRFAGHLRSSALGRKGRARHGSRSERALTSAWSAGRLPGERSQHTEHPENFSLPRLERQHLPDCTERPFKRTPGTANSVVHTESGST